MKLTRRQIIRAAGASALTLPSLNTLLWPRRARAAIGDTLTIAYNAAPAGWDPNTGPQTTSPGNQSIYRSIFDPYVTQRADLTLGPGVCEEFGWNADKSSIRFKLREGVKWQDGRVMTPEDIAWNLERLTDPKGGGPLQSIFASIKNLKVAGRDITFDVTPWRANMLERMSFLGIYLIPPHYYKQVGKDGFEKKPMGSGPYVFDHYERGSFLRLKAFKDYWGGAPPFETVIFKFVTDASSRVAEVERGTSDITLDVPYEEYDRLRAKPGLAGDCSPISDIAMVFINNEGAFADANVRKAAVHAVDKRTIVERLHRGYATPIDTLLAPQYGAYDPSIKTTYDPKLAAELLAKSGYSREKPIELTFQTTRGYKPKDYETVQAITEMWRRVGIKANIEVYEIAKHFELRAAHKLAPAAFYNWGNSTADPESSLGSALFTNSPHSSWKGKDLDERLIPLFTEKDTAKRFAGYKALNRYVAENAYVLPLFQFYLPVVYKAELGFKPHAAGYLLPFTMRAKG
ncbi:MAG TPA: ABC transporter substrate-binding protein [Alphaproteobacteria bacterium]